MRAARLEHNVQLQLTTSLMSVSNANLTALQWHSPMYFMVIPIRIYAVYNEMNFNSANFEIQLASQMGHGRVLLLASEFVPSLAT